MDGLPVLTFMPLWRNKFQLFYSVLARTVHVKLVSVVLRGDKVSDEVVEAIGEMVTLWFPLPYPSR